MIIVKVVLIMGRNSFICILSIIPIIFIVRAIGVEIEEGSLMGDYTKRPPVPLNFFSEGGYQSRTRSSRACTYGLYSKY